MEEENLSTFNVASGKVNWVNPSNLHHFEPQRFNKPTFCECCNSMIWGLVGKQGQQCIVCKLACHHNCVKETPNNCNSPTTKWNNGHSYYESSFSTPSYCPTCHDLVGKGAICKICEITVHLKCKNLVPTRCPTTHFKTELSTMAIAHYWIEGVCGGVCSNCKEGVGTSTHLSGFRCFWCSKKACKHKCKVALDSKFPNCDMGITSDLKLPPTSLIIENIEQPSTWKVVLPLPKECTNPLIVFVNPKSGGNLGTEVIQTMIHLVNPHQIFDLTIGGPTPGVSFMYNNSDVPWRVLACGGDGTVAWVLSVIDLFSFTNVPPVGVIPLGTGNDLSRALGWGGGVSDPSNELSQIVTTLTSDGFSTKLDRWTLKLEPLDTVNHVEDQKICNNYFSIGVDAKIALSFHMKRTSNPHYFTNQTINKMWYAKFGTDTMVGDGCVGLQNSVKLIIDDREVVYPCPLEAIVVVNLPSCYGGAFLWLHTSQIKETNSKEGTNYHPANVSDNLLEVVGIKNSVHLGQVQIGLASPVILGQGKNISLSFQMELPVQLDGEPWIQPPSKITLAHIDKQATVLASKEKAHKAVKIGYHG